jgi:hypothetical protein
MKKVQLPMRLLMRCEGDMWNAYVARGDTREGEIWIGSILVRLIESNEGRKQAFISLMTEAVSDAIEEIFGQKPTWKQQEAPEHERSKE